MKRRQFIRNLSLGGSALAAGPIWPGPGSSAPAPRDQEWRADIVIAGGGLGGCAAALAALRNGRQVIMTEETDWIGGQLTQQGLSCPDEHPWIETHGANRSYRALRAAVRTYYRRYYPLTPAAAAQAHLNPGGGGVSRLCHEPRVSLAVLYELLAPYLSTGRLRLLLGHRVVRADVDGDRVRALQAQGEDGRRLVLNAAYFLDATELGDLLPLTGTEYVTGAEARSETRELHAPEKADLQSQQAFTYCLAMDYLPGVHLVIDKPQHYDRWRRFVPDLSPPWSGPLLDLAYSNPRTLERKALGFHPEGGATGKALNLWTYRRIIRKDNFLAGQYTGDITVMNWPQNDYMGGPLVDVPPGTFRDRIAESRQLSLSLFYWLQTEVPRPDGGQGWPGLRLRGDIMGTADGLAKYPYIRESRRIRAAFTILEEHVGAENRVLVAGKEKGRRAAEFPDSVGVGYYHIDLHPSSAGCNYLDFGSLPFQIPLGALLPKRMQNLLPANKNIGTTHITNGCYRLHPVEWGIGEAAGMLAAYALDKKTRPAAVRSDAGLMEDFRRLLHAQGVETRWP